MKRNLLLSGLAALTLCGCGGSDNVAVNSGSPSILAPNTPLAPPPPAESLNKPRALDDSYVVVEGQPVTGNVLANDAINGATIVDFPPPGRLALSPSGQFTYTPAAEDGVETFTYTIQNASGRSTATVTLGRAPSYYVDNTRPNGGNGSKGRPFNTLRAALQAAEGLPATIIVARGTGQSEGLGDNYQLSGGQSIIGQDAAAPPVIGGTITVAEGTTLKDLQFLVTRTNITGGPSSRVNLTNLSFFDEGSLSPAIQLAGITDLQLSGLNFTNVPSAFNVTDLRGDSNSVTDVSLNNVGNGLNFGVNTGETWLVLKGLKSVTTDRALNFQVAGATTDFHLSAYDSEFTRSPGTAVISADISGSAHVQAILVNWKSPPFVGQGNAQYMDWKVRESGVCILRMEACKMETPGSFTSVPNVPQCVDALNLSSQDHGQLLFVHYKNAFSYPNAVNIAGRDDAALWVRMEQYPVDVDNQPIIDFPVTLTGQDNCQAYAVFRGRYGGNHIQWGIDPTFNFTDQSRLFIVKLFGTYTEFGATNTLWEALNVGSNPVINGYELTLAHQQTLNPKDFPNFISLPSEDGLAIPEPSPIYRL